MHIALYKGRGRLFSKIVCFWTQSPYSHCELVFSDGMCGSSYDLDLGVRLTKIDFDPRHWDFLKIEGDEEYARSWFEAHAKEPYDYVGLLSYVLPIKNNPYKWTCVKAVLTALKYEDAWRFEPSMLPSLFKAKPCSKLS